MAKQQKKIIVDNKSSTDMASILRIVKGLYRDNRLREGDIFDNPPFSFTNKDYGVKGELVENKNSYRAVFYDLD